MRVNVYYEEMTTEAVVVTKTADTGNTFHGCRVLLASPTALHYHAGDDDRPAVTFWFKDAAEAQRLVDAFRRR